MMRKLAFPFLNSLATFGILETMDTISSDSALSTTNPTLVGLCMLQDEADIIEYTVRANLLLLDHFVLIVQPSSDGSLEILDELVHEGLPITIWRRPINYYAQTSILTSIAARVQDAFAPDFLFMLDADEILRARSRGELLENLWQIPPENVGAIPWKTYVAPESTPTQTACSTPQNGLKCWQ
jgi:hypothetical protein